MLQKITRVLFLILALYCGQIFCMDGYIDWQNRQIEVLKNGEEIIYIIENTVGELLDEIFLIFMNLTKSGRFDEGKIRLDNFCNNLADSLRLNVHELNCPVDDLQKLLRKFERRSESLLATLDKSDNAVLAGFNDAMGLLGLFSAFAAALMGATALDAEMVLIALVVTMIVNFKPLIFFMISMAFAVKTTMKDPQLIFSFAMLIPFIVAINVAIIDDKRIKKNKQIESIKGILNNFTAKLRLKINEHFDNSETNENTFFEV